MIFTLFCGYLYMFNDEGFPKKMAAGKCNFLKHLYVCVVSV